jgi:Right handed beta helix region
MIGNTMKRFLYIFLFFLLMCGHGLAADVYIKDVGGTVYYESGASSCDDVTSGDTAGDLQDAINSAGVDGYIHGCSNLTGTQIDSDKVANMLTGQTLECNDGVTIDADGANRAIYNSTNDWTIRNCIFTGGAQEGVQVNGARTGWTFDNVTATLNLIQGIRISGGGGAVTGTITDCTTTYNGTSGATSHGIRIDNAPGSTISVTNLTSNNNGVFVAQTDGRGISLSDGSTGVTISDSSLTDNGYLDGSGLELSGSSAIISNSIISGSEAAIEAKGSTAFASSLTAKSNLLLGSVLTGENPVDGTGLECTTILHNNTIISSGSIVIDIMSPNYDIRNNIVQSTNTGDNYLFRFGNMSDADINSGTITNNDYYYPNLNYFAIRDTDLSNGGTVKTFVDMAAFITDYPTLMENCLDAIDPLFVSATNYGLQSLSPCINAGTNVGCSSCKDFTRRVVTAADGSGLFGEVDIGAYEYVPGFTGFTPSGGDFQ